MKKTLLFAVLGAVALGAGCTSSSTTTDTTATATDFRDCAAKSGVILESYPRQCRIGGASFTEDIGNALSHADLIIASSPMPGDTVTSPLTLSGEARGTWYFEASFPVEVQDADGNVIGSGHAEAQGDWMTTSFVPFTATVSFTTPATETGTLVLRKDNPSGLPANDDELTIPIVF